jgi:transmembrane sensor
MHSSLPSSHRPRADGFYIVSRRSGADEPPNPPGGPPQNSISRLFAVLAAAALTTCSASLFVGDAIAVKYFSTRVGEQLPVRLADGSVITLNTQSGIKMQFDGPYLRVEVTRGEVLFDMRPNPYRHLIASAGSLQIIDTATIFAVERLDTAETRVTVEEGQVELSAAARTETRVQYNQQATVDYQTQLLSIHIRNVKPRDIQRQLSWRLGRLEFDRDRVSDAVQQINRYNLTQIRVEGAAGEERIGGTFSPDDPTTFVRAMVATIPNIRCESIQRPGEPLVLRIQRAVPGGRGSAASSGCPPEDGRVEP